MNARKIAFAPCHISEPAFRAEKGFLAIDHRACGKAFLEFFSEGRIFRSTCQQSAADDIFQPFKFLELAFLALHRFLGDSRAYLPFPFPQGFNPPCAIVVAVRAVSHKSPWHPSANQRPVCLSFPFGFVIGMGGAGKLPP